MMPIGLGKEFTARGEEQIKAVLESAYGSMTPTGERLGNGPCHYYTLENFQGRIGFISALSHKFCAHCNRVRLTSTGFMKGCLHEKPAGHNFQEKKKGNEESRIMAQIGG